MGEAARGKKIREILWREAEGLLAHLAAEVFAVVGEKIDDDDAAGWFQDARGFFEVFFCVGGVGEDEEQKGGVDAGVGDGQRLQITAAEVDVFVIGKKIVLLRPEAPDPSPSDTP